MIKAVIYLETEHRVFVRRMRLLIDGSRFYVSINKLRNPWATTSLTLQREKEELERVKRWVTQAVASFWIRNRTHRLYLDLDIRNGGLLFTIHDWGIKDVPPNTVFMDAVAKYGRTEFSETREGFFYDDPEAWTDVETEQKNYKTLAQIVAEEVARADQGGATAIYVPPLEEP